MKLDINKNWRKWPNEGEKEGEKEEDERGEKETLYETIVFTKCTHLGKWLVFISIRGHIGIQNFPHAHLFTWINIRIGVIDLHFSDFPDFLVLLADFAVVNFAVVIGVISVIVV
jgi:hypothetical protein